MTKTKAPAFQWYPKDILTSQRVQLMDLKTECAYRRAIDYCWLNGNIPADAKKLAILIGKGCTAKIAESIKDMFISSPGDENKLIHIRLEEEREKQLKWSEKSSEGGRRGAETRWKNNKGGDKGGSQMVEDCLQPKHDTASSSSISNKMNGEDKPPKAPRVVFIKPSLQQVTEYFFERCEKLYSPQFISAQAGLWLDYYTSNGWKVGSNKMKDWEAAVRTWINRIKNTPTESTAGLIVTTGKPLQP